MARYIHDNSIEEFGYAPDEDMTDAGELNQPDYAVEVDEEDLAWDLPDSGNEPELDADEDAAWEAGTLALLDEPQGQTDHYGNEDAEIYQETANDLDDAAMDCIEDEPCVDEYHDHSGYPDDEMPDCDGEYDPEEHHDHSEYLIDEMPEPENAIYTAELPALEALLDTGIIGCVEEDPAAEGEEWNTDVVPITDEDTVENTASFDTESILILDAAALTSGTSGDTDIIEIAGEEDDSDTDVIRIIDEGIPNVTDLIPIINTEDLAGTDELEIPTDQGTRMETGVLERDGAENAQSRRRRTALDYAIWVAGAVAAVLAVVAGLRYRDVLTVRAETARYQALGSALAGIGTIGEDQITAIRAERVQKDADRKEAEQKAAKKAELVANEGTVPVTMTLATVQSDLKIKIHGENGNLISGVPFKVSVQLPSGQTAAYEDDDQDGIIYQTGLSKGTYKVTMEQLVADAGDGTDVTETDAYKSYSQYKIPTDTQSIDVTDKIAYAAIDVKDEIKTTAQVNVAAEDTQQKIATESEVQDTVEYVESTTTAATTTAEEDALYEAVDRSEIVDPNVSARADLIIGRFHMLAEDGGDAESSSTEAATTAEENSDSVEAATTAEENSDSAEAATTTEENSEEGDEQNSDQSDSSQDDGDDGDNAENGDGDGDTDNSEGDDGEQDKRTYTTTIKGSTTVAAGSTTLITASTDEPGATTYTWELEGDAISIDRKDGKTVTVTGEHEGSATLTATAHLVAEGADPAENVVSTTITVTAAEETSGKRLTVSPSSVTLVAGKTQTLSVTLDGVDDDGVSYESAESAIAEVSDDGTITAHAAGETTVTVTANADSSLKQSVKIKVVETETNADGNTLLKDKNGNQIYVKDNGTYREATAADYDTFDAFYRKIEGKATTGEFKYTGWQNIGGKTYYFNSAGEPVTGHQVINGASYTFGDDGALTSGTSKVGIDVSQWNGSISWSQVASSGISYAIVRCGYRGSATGTLIKDPNYATNMAGATAAGLKVGIYVFSQAVNEVEAVEEASMAISMASGYGVSLPIFIDVEAAGGRADSLSTSERTAIVSAFCQTVQASGYSAGIYSNTNWLSERVNTPALTSYHIWVAQYTSSLAYSRTRYDIWQYSSKGRVAGISGDVDMNMSYRSY